MFSAAIIYNYRFLSRSVLFKRLIFNFIDLITDDFGNVGNKGLRREEQNEFSKKKLYLPPVGIEPWTLGIILWHICGYILIPSSLSLTLLIKTKTFSIPLWSCSFDFS